MINDSRVNGRNLSGWWSGLTGNATRDPWLNKEMFMKSVETENRVSAIPAMVLGVPFDPVTMADAVDLIDRMIASRKPHYVVTPNVDFLVQAQNDPELHRILVNANLVLCDGTPIVWASHLLGQPLPERVAGADIVPRLIERAARRGHRLFLLGAIPESAARATENLRRAFPDLVVSSYSPPFRELLEMDHDEIARRIAIAKPDLLLVSLGCPKQEKWIAMNYRSLGVPVTIGVGATIDFLAGHVRRAPVWMQRSGTEWLFRLAQEPRRLLKRYIRDLGVFGVGIARQCLRWRCKRTRAASPPPARQISLADECGSLRMTASNRMVHETVSSGAPVLSRILKAERDCVVQLNGAHVIDSAGIGMLVRLRKNLELLDCRLVLTGVKRAVQRALADMHLEELFLSAPDVPAARQMIAECRTEFACPVEVRPSFRGAVLACRGEITAANGDRFWAAIQPHVAATAGRKWTIDLSRVRFIDSRGIQLMLDARQLSHPSPPELAFINPRPAVSRVLKSARLEVPAAIPPRLPSRAPERFTHLVLAE